MPLTNAQKRALAAELIHTAASLFENWEERGEAGLLSEEAAAIDADEAAQYIANLLKHLPGTAWDTRLPTPQ